MATCPDEADWDLVIGVLDVLDKYGYRNAGEPYTGRAVVLVRTLARVYSGMSE